MKKHILLTLISGLFVLWSMPSFAGPYVEPWVGYSFSGDAESNTLDDSITGTGLGFRAGYSFMGLGFGAEYASYSMDWDTSTERDVEMTDISAVVSYDFPVLVRAYAAILIKGDGEISGSGLTTTDLEKGSGTKLGVGFTGFPFVVINLELIDKTYEDKDSSDELDVKQYMLSASLPLP